MAHPLSLVLQESIVHHRTDRSDRLGRGLRRRGVSLDLSLRPSQRRQLVLLERIPPFDRIILCGPIVLCMPCNIPAERLILPHQDQIQNRRYWHRDVHRPLPRRRLSLPKEIPRLSEPVVPVPDKCTATMRLFLHRPLQLSAGPVLNLLPRHWRPSLNLNLH